MPTEQRSGPMKPSWNFEIDRYVNPFVFPAPVEHLPSLARRLLGRHDHPPPPSGNILAVVWAFVGALGSLSLIFAVCRQIPVIEDRGGPLILGSFGAAAVLEFYAIESPLSQPRNMVLGQLISSIVGVAINKGFAQASPDYAELRWLAGSLSCACSIVAMGLTGTVHPPAGATALLAATDDSVAGLGWTLVPLVMLSCALMLPVALLVNNVQRVFPAYWWTAGEVGSFWRSGGRAGADGSGPGPGPGQGVKTVDRADSEAGRSGCDDAELGTASPEDGFLSITITKRGVFVPSDVHLELEERIFLERLRHKTLMRCTRIESVA